MAVTDACQQTYVLVALSRCRVIVDLKVVVQEINVECSGRDEMCKSVLNDEWVSHPSFSSEDSVFMAHKKNLYEEALHHRIIKKIYGREAGLEVLQAMQDTPALALPVVLIRLKQKEGEWKRAQREWNKIWRAVDAANYVRSLDHRGITFKMADKKAL